MLPTRRSLIGAVWLAAAAQRVGAPVALGKSKHVSAPRKHAAHRPLVMLDPGHGGRDPGCMGHAGTQEKHVVLAVAHALRQRLHASGRYRVALTRADDRFIPLSGRVQMARARGAALMVSLHANASPDPSVAGASVYRFADRPSDQHASAVAASENSAGERKPQAARDLSPRVLQILAALMRRETMAHAIMLQQAVVDRLDDHVAMLGNAAPHARFAVLSAPDIPAVLVELGFLSNRAEETRLRQAHYQGMLAASLARGIDAYFAAARLAAEAHPRPSPA